IRLAVSRPRRPLQPSFRTHLKRPELCNSELQLPPRPQRNPLIRSSASVLNLADRCVSMVLRNTRMLSIPWADLLGMLGAFHGHFHLENILRSFLLLSMHVLGVWLAALGVPISFFFLFASSFFPCWCAFSFSFR